MKKMLFLILIVSALVTGCFSSSGSDDNNTTEEKPKETISTDMPDKIMVSIPASVTNEEAKKSINRTSKRFGEEKSYAYNQLVDKVAELEDQVEGMAMTYVLAEELLKSISTSGEQKNGVTIVITEEMVKKAAEMAEIEEIDYNSMMYLVGDTVTIDSYKYYREKVSDDSIFGTATINIIEMVINSFAFVDETENPEVSKMMEKFSYVSKIKWNDEKNKVKTDFQVKYDGKEAFLSSIGYDDNEKLCVIEYNVDTAAMIIDEVEVDMAMTAKGKMVLQEDKKSTKNGVLVSMDDNINSTLMTMICKTNGYIDDEGGYLESEIKVNMIGFESNYRTKEGFDGNGNLLYLQEWVDGKWENPEGYEEFNVEFEYDEMYEDGEGSFEYKINFEW